MYIYSVTRIGCETIFWKTRWCVALHLTKNKFTRLKKLFEQERAITSLVVATPFDFNIFFFWSQGPPSWGEAWHSRLGVVYWTTASGMMSSFAGTTPKLPWWWTDLRPISKPMDFSTGLTLTKRSGTSGYGDTLWDITVKLQCWLWIWNVHRILFR